MSIALGRLAKEDPSFRVRTDEESGQTIIAGMGELHLDIIVDRMKREFNVEANIGKPMVAYRETIKRLLSKKVSSYVKLVVKVNSVTYTYVQNRLILKLVKNTNSLKKLQVAWYLKNSSVQLTKVSKNV